MEIKIQGDPGTGNTFQEIHIGNVQNYVPNATTVINHNYGSSPKAKDKDPDGIDHPSIRQEIVNYVGKTLKLVERKWQDRYLDLWNDILDLEVVADEVYDRGRQKGTLFNRKLVANIIHYLGNFRGNGSGMYGSYSASPVANVLENTTYCSTRTELGSQPSRAIRDAIAPLLQKHNIY